MKWDVQAEAKDGQVAVEKIGEVVVLTVVGSGAAVVETDYKVVEVVEKQG
jgi:hypothetical protein